MHARVLSLSLFGLLAAACGAEHEAAGGGAGAASSGAVDSTRSAGGQSGARSTRRALPRPTKISHLATADLDRPAGIWHDAREDLYLITNAPTEGAAFVARVSPEGAATEVRWIDGADASVTLEDPRGIAVLLDLVFVADRTTLRTFDRRTGQSRGDVEVSGAGRLEGVALTQDGAVLVTDSGRGAVWRVAVDLGASDAEAAALTAVNAEVELFAEHDQLKGARGIVVSPDGDTLCVTESGHYLFVAKRQDPLGTKLEIQHLGGLVRTDAGLWVVSSRVSGQLYAVSAAGDVDVLAAGAPDVVALGYDRIRDRVLGVQSGARGGAVLVLSH